MTSSPGFSPGFPGKEKGHVGPLERSSQINCGSVIPRQACKPNSVHPRRWRGIGNHLSAPIVTNRMERFHTLHSGKSLAVSYPVLPPRLAQSFDWAVLQFLAKPSLFASLGLAPTLRSELLRMGVAHYRFFSGA